MAPHAGQQRIVWRLLLLISQSSGRDKMLVFLTPYWFHFVRWWQYYVGSHNKHVLLHRFLVIHSLLYWKAFYCLITRLIEHSIHVYFLVLTVLLVSFSWPSRLSSSTSASVFGVFMFYYIAVSTASHSGILLLIRMCCRHMFLSLSSEK